MPPRPHLPATRYAAPLTHTFLLHPFPTPPPPHTHTHIQVRVVRQGAEASVSCHDLLVGDVVLLEAGDILPADGLLLPGGSPLR
jgi:hypothetical protein